MLGLKYLLILISICMIYSCKCQDLEKYVAPILDNRGAPLVAIVDTNNISSHIVRSIEIPLREIINSTIECKIKEELKEDKVSGKVLKDVNGQLETLQQKIDEHIGDNRNQFTEVKQDIVTLRKETDEKITNEILKQMKSFTKIVNTVTIDLDEKVKNLNNIVEIMQSELRETILSVNNNASNLAEQLETHSNRLYALHSNIQELTVNTYAIQSGMNEVRSTANVNNGRLGGHESRLDDLNAKVNTINSRERLHVVAFYAYLSTNIVNPSARHTLIYDVAKTNSGNGYNAVTGIFTAPTAGIYVFTWVTRMYEASYSTERMVNNAVFGASVSRIRHELDVSVSGTVVTKINKGDSVFVRVHSTRAGWGVFHSEQLGRSSFAGFLIH